MPMELVAQVLLVGLVFGGLAFGDRVVARLAALDTGGESSDAVDAE